MSVGISLTLITLLIYYSESHHMPFFATLRYLYVIPITYTALHYGRRAGISVALLVTSLFLPILINILLAQGFLATMTIELLLTLILFNVLATFGGGLADRETSQKERYRTLNYLSEAFGRELQRSELARIILVETRRALVAESGALWLGDPDSETCHLIASVGTIPTPQSPKQQHIETSIARPLVQWVLQNNRPLRLENPAVDPRFLVPPTTPPIRDVLVMPLRRAGIPFGVLILYNRQFQTFSPQDAELLAEIATKSEMALDKAELYNTLEMRVQQRTQALAEERNKLAVVFDSIADGLIVLDRAHTVLMVNQVIVDFFKQDASTLIGRNAWEIFPSTSLRDVVTHAQTGPETRITADVVLPNGTVLRASVGLLGDVDAGPSGVVLVLRDVTHELSTQRMLTDFVTMTSHELRTPLTGIIGFARLVQKQFAHFPAEKLAPGNLKWAHASHRIQNNLTIIIEEGQRMAEMITEVLDIAKLEAKRLKWAQDEVTIADLIQESLAGHQSRGNDKGLRLEAHVAPDIPPLYADKERLLQVLNHLLSNAIKFTDTGNISVRAWKLAPGDDIAPISQRAPDTQTGLPSTYPMLAVSVQDSGVGIIAEDLPHVCEKFKQVGNLTAGTRRRGTGLGLPICREIIQHYHGHIWVESAPDEGSRFVFTLPLDSHAGLQTNSE